MDWFMVNAVESGTRKQQDRGFTILELLMSLFMLVTVVGGLAAVYMTSANANQIDAINVQLVNSARAKIEQIRSIPYAQVGIDASGTPSGPGYFVCNPVYFPVYKSNPQLSSCPDILLSDSLTLSNGSKVTRTVTVSAIDDPADGTGSNDQDGVTDPNTGTILDYKQVAVTATMTVNNSVFTKSLYTDIQGALVSEIDGATGKDAAGAPPPAPGGGPAPASAGPAPPVPGPAPAPAPAPAPGPAPAPTPGPGGGPAGPAGPPAPGPPPAPPAGCSIVAPPAPKGPGLQGVSTQSPC